MGFEICKELAAEKTKVDFWPLCDVLLVHDSHYPGWLVLVPRRENVTELVDLTAEDQILLMHEIRKASVAVQKAFSPYKLNVATLGNVVAQLHVHIVPRFQTDKSWPGPVWGAHPSKPFQPDELRVTLSKIENAFFEAGIAN